MREEDRILREPAGVRQAVDSAREFAENKGVAMTLERLAVCLGIGRKSILSFLDTAEKELDGAQRETQALLRRAYEEIAASQAEHGMMKGSHSTMDVLLLKNNHGYGEKTEPETEPDKIVFTGEDEIPE